MKKTNKITTIICAAAISTALITGISSCSQEDFPDGSEGYLALTAKVSTDMEIARSSRAELSGDLAEKCIIWISNSKGPVRKYQGLENLPQESIALLSGHYIAEAWTGDSVSASFTDRWFKGREEFDIQPLQTSAITVNCKIANVGVAVEYFEGVNDLLDNLKMEVGHKRGKLSFDGIDSRTGYFMMPSYDKNLAWKFSADDKSGSKVEKNGVIENAQPGKLYILHIKYNGQGGADNGGAFFHIEVEETDITVEDEVEISVNPIIEGVGFDFSEPQTNGSYGIGDKTIKVYAGTGLDVLELSMPGLGAMVGIEGSDSFGLFKASDENKAKLKAAGIDWIYNIMKDGTSMMVINLTSAFTDRITQEGTHMMSFRAVDKDNRQTIKNLTFEITDEPVQPLEITVEQTEDWFRKATLRGRVIKAPATGARFDYREMGATEWQHIDAMVDGTTMSAVITGLTPGKTYEYTASTADFQGGKTFTFISYSPQLPNSGFESWLQVGRPWLLTDSEVNIFWDSGNHGSTTMGANYNITVSDTSIKHGGTCSARLGSRFVGIGAIGKFAAGNAFVGKYLATEGTDGVLGWGREWPYAASAMKGYVKYRPGSVEYIKEYCPPECTKGITDNGIIYVALVDGTLQTYTDKDKKIHSYPQIVKTNDKDEGRQLFSKDQDNVIAYGEVVFTANTPGEDMVPFEIKLNYKSGRENEKPAYIIVVASASRWGDYFSGGNSTMWIDDFELVY